MDVNLDRLLTDPIYAMSFQYMIGDLEDFLEFSELNVDWQYRRELLAIERQTGAEELPYGYLENLKTSAEHRFTVSLPLRVRYGAVIALITSVEWSVCSLIKALKRPVKRPIGSKENETVYHLSKLDRELQLSKSNVILDYKALVQIRNCIAHAAGIEAHHKYPDDLRKAVDRLGGFSLETKHFLGGRHVWIERDALTPYIREMSGLIVVIHRAASEQGLCN